MIRASQKKATTHCVPSQSHPLRPRSVNHHRDPRFEQNEFRGVPATHLTLYNPICHIVKLYANGRPYAMIISHDKKPKAPLAFHFRQPWRNVGKRIRRMPSRVHKSTPAKHDMELDPTHKLYNLTSSLPVREPAYRAANHSANQVHASYNSRAQYIMLPPRTRRYDRKCGWRARGCA